VPSGETLPDIYELTLQSTEGLADLENAVDTSLAYRSREVLILSCIPKPEISPDMKGNHFLMNVPSCLGPDNRLGIEHRECPSIELVLSPGDPETLCVPPTYYTGSSGHIAGVEPRAHRSLLQQVRATNYRNTKIEKPKKRAKR